MKTKAIRFLTGFFAACLLFSACGTGKQTDGSSEGAASTENQAENGTKDGSAGTFTDSPEKLEKAAKSVVKLETFDAGGKRIATGSGFAAIEKGVLITSAHVIVNMDHLTATTDGGETFTVDRVIEADKDKDIAICLMPEEADLPVLVLSKETPLRGEKTAVIGSQFGILNLVTTGNYCGSWTAAGIDWLLFTAPVSGGSSGAPLFNDAGEVIGVVTGTYDEGQNMNLAAPASSVTGLYGAAAEETK